MLNNLNVIVFVLLVAIFFFKLSEVPLFSLGQLYYQNTICCWLTGKAILSALKQVCKSSLYFYTDTKQLDQVIM